MVTLTAGPTDQSASKRSEYRIVGPSLIQCPCNGLVPTTNANLAVKERRGQMTEWGWKCPKCGSILN